MRLGPPQETEQVVCYNCGDPVDIHSGNAAYFTYSEEGSEDLIFHDVDKDCVFKFFLSQKVFRERGEQ